MTTMTSALLRLLEDGPGTSGELAAELAVGWRSCAANLHRLWIEGRIDRDVARVRVGQRGAPACVYGLLGTFSAPDARPNPRLKRVRVYTKRIRPYKYRDRREYGRLRRQRLAGTLSSHARQRTSEPSNPSQVNKSRDHWRKDDDVANHQVTASSTADGRRPNN